MSEQTTALEWYASVRGVQTAARELAVEVGSGDRRDPMIPRRTQHHGVFIADLRVPGDAIILTTDFMGWMPFGLYLRDARPFFGAGVISPPAARPEGRAYDLP